jgi:hypothetical protein
VFCGSSSGKKPSYQLAAIQLGQELVICSISVIIWDALIARRSLFFLFAKFGVPFIVVR